MLLRIVTIAIVLFWLGSVGWLCAVIWAPPESRMKAIDPREVMDVFFEWNESTNMALLENGMRRGHITVAGGSGPDPNTGVFTNLLSISAVIEEYSPDSEVPRVDLVMRLSVDFSDEMVMKRSTMSVRIPRQGLNAHLSVEGDPPEIEASVTMGTQSVFNYQGQGDKGGAGIPASILPMGSMLGIESINPSSIEWELDARMGKFTFGGRTQRAYLFIMRAPEQNQSLRIYFSEVGEPLRVESDLGYEAVSEILAPIDRKRTERQDPSDD